ncbi:AAA family ATPase [Streptomyces sp. NPDC057136]|uniref:helix-turn-helix transcriptional regulator n=1 Tax=Streptomyces sp. NPDC057136 TaxID=3346029 RepID=UPI00363F093D
MPFVERCSEMGRLQDIIKQCDQGKSHVVLVTGAVASGKTELLHQFAEEAVASGALLLTATSSHAERTLPLGVIGQLFCNPALPAPIVEQVNTLLSEDALPTPSPGHEPVTMRQTAARLARSLFSTLMTLSADRTVVIGIDDIQYTDGPSLQILLFLLRRLHSGRLLVILNEWSASQPTHPAFRAELLRLPNCHRIQLRPLSEAGVAAVLGEFLDETTAEQLAPAYHDVSGGNPLLLRGLAEDGMVRLSGGSDTLSSKPLTGDSFRQAVFTCLYRWDRSTIEVACGMAMLGGWATPALLSQLIGMKPESAAQIVGTLSRSGLLKEDRFRHPAVNVAVLDTMALDDRVRLHLRAAQLLHDSGIVAIGVAEQFVAAGQIQEQWAVGVLQDASEQALTQDKVDFALECLELAQRSCTDERHKAQLTMALARLQWRAQPSAAARHLAPLRQALLAGHLEARDAVTVTRFLLWRGRTDEARETLEWLHESAGTSDPQIVAELQTLQPWLYLGQSPVLDRLADKAAAQRAERLPQDQRGAGLISIPSHPALTACAALSSVLTEGPSEKAIGWAEQVLAGCTLSDSTLASVMAALSALIHADRPDKAAPWCHVFLGEARARRATSWEALLSGARAEIALRQGDLPTAERWARDALRLISPNCWGVAIGYPLAVLMLAQTAMSKHEEVSQLVRQVVPEAIFQSRFALKYLHARGHHYLATNRLQAALADFQRCGELMNEWDLDLAALVPWRSDSAQVQLSLNRREAATDLVTEQLAMPGSNGPRTRGMSLRVLAAARDPKQRPLLLREAIDLLQESGDRVQLVCALADLSRADHHFGEFNRARMMGRRAMQVAQDCGAEQLCQRLLSTHDSAENAAEPETGTAVDGSESLSDAERRVAALAAVGHSNREIGRKLYITVSTVEQHLTRVYRKLSVEGRSDLPLRLKDGDYGAPRLAMAQGWTAASGS